MPARRGRRDVLRLTGAAGVAYLLQACAGPLAQSTPTPAAARLKVSYGAPVGSFAPLWMAEAIGAFDKYGVGVDIAFIETNTGVAAMLANDTDVMEVSAAPVITADVNGKADLVMIASALNHPILGLYAQPPITSAEALKGKAIAADKPGTPVDYAARLSLSLLGLQPSDVQLLPIGGGPEILAAMLSGQVPAGMVAPPQTFQVEAKGFRLLQDIFSRPYQNVAMVAKKSRLDELGARVRPLLAAYRDGILAWNSQPELAKQTLDKYAKVGDPDILQKTYEFYTKTAPFEPSLKPTMEGIQAMMDFLSTTIPAVAETKPEQFVDLRFLSDLPSA
jgi:NitT/TauT family transport system substrate-binding protein